MENAARLSPNILAQIVDRFGARLDARAESQTPSCWRFPLHKCNAVAQTDFGHDRKEYASIEIVDLNSRGLGFKTDAPVTTGALFTVILRIPGIPPQTWTCRVVGVHAFDGHFYTVGATFENSVAQVAVPVAAGHDAGS
jgi:hypothetical protein